MPSARKILSSVLLATLLARPALAQNPGGLSGKVADSSGGVIANAFVSLKFATSSQTRETTTDGRGRYKFEGLPDGVYIVTAIRDGFAPVTQEVKVTAQAAAADFTLNPAGFTEQVDVAFTAPHATSALRFDVPVQDIPLSVKSYTNAFMKAIETRAVADLYTYMTGVNRTGDTAFDFAIRGLRAGVGNLQYNGLPGVVARMGSPSTTNVERIEILKGPASVLYGQAAPGGIVNIITKRPQSERSNNIDIRGGSFVGKRSSFGDDSSYRVSADFTGPIDKGRKFLYRLVASRDQIGFARDFVRNHETYIVPSLTWVVSEGSILTAEFEYRKDDTKNDLGLAAPRNDISLVAAPNVRYQEPDDFQDESGKALGVFFTKQWQGGLVYNATLRSVFHKDQRKTYESAAIVNNANVNLITLTRRDRNQFNERKYDFVDMNLKKSVKTGSVQHTFLFGLNGGYELTDFNRAQFATGLPVNIYAPVYGAAPLRATPTTWQRSDFYNKGGYIQDQIAFSSKVKALGGLRYDSQQTKFKDRRTGQLIPDKNTTATLPMVGLVFQPNTQWSVYGSYSSSFSPALPTALNAAGLPSFDPERGRQIEGGIKADLGNGKADVTAAYFHIEKDNVLNTVAGVTETFGQLRSKGVEFDFRWKPLTNLQIISGYAYADSIVSKDKVATNVGSRGLNAPKHNFNFWTRYDVQKGALKGLGLGLGVGHQSDRAGSTPLAVVPTGFQSVLILPAFTRVDATMHYVRSRAEFTLKIANVGDALYYEAANAVTNIFVSSPREATLTMRLRF